MNEELVDELNAAIAAGGEGGRPIPGQDAIAAFARRVRGKGLGGARRRRPGDEPPAAAPAAASSPGPRPGAGGAATSPSRTTATRTHTTARTAGNDHDDIPF